MIYGCDFMFLATAMGLEQSVLDFKLKLVNTFDQENIYKYKQWMKLNLKSFWNRL